MNPSWFEFALPDTRKKAYNWKGLSKTNRCFGRSGRGHTKRECPAGRGKDQATDGAARTQKLAKTKSEKDDSSVKGHLAGDEAKGVSEAPAAKHSNGPEQGGDRRGSSTSAEADDPSRQLIQKAANLLKTLRSMKAMKLKSLGGEDGATDGWALLDGGATHGPERTNFPISSLSTWSWRVAPRPSTGRPQLAHCFQERTSSP